MEAQGGILLLLLLLLLFLFHCLLRWFRGRAREICRWRRCLPRAPTRAPHPRGGLRQVQRDAREPQRGRSPRGHQRARRGGASVAALALAATAGAVTGTLEQIPFFKFFEESIGIAVSAYYANRLGGNFLTATGRERFRLELIENFTRVTGKAALAGKLARTDPELDAQIRGLIGNLEDLPEGGAELPENVREAVAAFIRIARARPRRRRPRFAHPTPRCAIRWTPSRCSRRSSKRRAARRRTREPTSRF